MRKEKPKQIFTFNSKRFDIDYKRREFRDVNDETKEGIKFNSPSGEMLIKKINEHLNK